MRRLVEKKVDLQEKIMRKFQYKFAHAISTCFRRQTTSVPTCYGPSDRSIACAKRLCVNSQQCPSHFHNDLHNLFLVKRDLKWSILQTEQKYEQY